MAHNSSRRCQSWLERASREASREKIAPTWPMATSLTSALKSSRLVVRAPDWPRSRSRIRICSELQPRDCALLARLYWRSVLSWLKRTCPIVDWRMEGANPAELPAQAPAKFEFAINLKTVTTLGLAVPPTVIALADEVIE